MVLAGRVALLSRRLRGVACETGGQFGAGYKGRGTFIGPGPKVANNRIGPEYEDNIGQGDA